MAEQSTDFLDAEIRRAVAAFHARLDVPTFEHEWEAARASIERPPRQSPRRWPMIPAPRRVAAAVLLAVGVTLAVRLMWEPPADERTLLPPPLAGAPAGAPAGAAAGEVVPVMWYAPTDELLDVASLGYAARPAALTTYDPIRLEVLP